MVDDRIVFAATLGQLAEAPEGSFVDGHRGRCGELGNFLFKA